MDFENENPRLRSESVESVAEISKTMSRTSMTFSSTGHFLVIRVFYWTL